MIHYRADLSYPNSRTIPSTQHGLLFPNHLASGTIRIYLPDEVTFRHFNVEWSIIGQVPQPSLLGENRYDGSIRLGDGRAREVYLAELEFTWPASSMLVRGVKNQVRVFIHEFLHRILDEFIEGVELLTDETLCIEEHEMIAQQSSCVICS